MTHGQESVVRAGISGESCHHGVPGAGDRCVRRVSIAAVVPASSNPANSRRPYGCARRASNGSRVDPEDQFARSAQSICDELKRQKGMRFTLILASGKVVADSDEDPRFMDDHADRPEFKQAISEGLGLATRFSTTLRRDLMYRAVPLGAEDLPTAVARASLALDTIAETFRDCIAKSPVWHCSPWPSRQPPVGSSCGARSGHWSRCEPALTATRKEICNTGCPWVGPRKFACSHGR